MTQNVKDKITEHLQSIDTLVTIECNNTKSFMTCGSTLLLASCEVYCSLLRGHQSQIHEGTNRGLKVWWQS